MKKPLIGLTMENSPAADQRPFEKALDVYYINNTYIRMMEKVDCVHVLLPTLKDLSMVTSVIDSIDGLLIPGGFDVFPEAYGEKPIDGKWKIDVPRTHYEIALIKEAIKQGKPILGICRGCQVLNVALGGSLFQDLPLQAPSSIQHSSPNKPQWSYHGIRIEKDSLLFSILGEDRLSVNSSHHQAIRNLAPGLRVVAEADDGIIEAIESDANTFMLGVQWHPEAMNDQSSSILLLQAFIESCVRPGQPSVRSSIFAERLL
jgi:putative glutamine amidotransferase